MGEKVILRGISDEQIKELQGVGYKVVWYAGQDADETYTYTRPTYKFVPAVTGKDANATRSHDYFQMWIFAWQDYIMKRNPKTGCRSGIAALDTVSLRDLYIEDLFEQLERW